MRILLVALQAPDASRADDDPAAFVPSAASPRESFPGEARTEQEQALALARGMRDAGRWAPLLLCRRGSWLADRAGELGLPCLTLGEGRAARLFACLRLWWRFRRQKHVLIQTIGADAVRWGARLSAWRRPFGPRATLLAHAFPVRPPASDIPRSPLRPSLLAAQKIFCGSEHIRERLHDAHCNEDSSRVGLPAERLERFLPCVDADRLRTTPLARENDGHIVFAMTESFLPQSGALPVLQAMLLLQQRDDLPPWEVRLYGNGTRCGEVLEEAQALGVQSRLCLLGPQPLGEVLRRCDVWLAPGQADAEAPATFWAGFAAGLPVIYSLSHLHREYLGHERPCLALPAVTPEKLAEAMRRLLLDAEARASLGRQARRAAAQVAEKPFAERMLALYTQWAAAWGWLDAADREALQPVEDTADSAPAVDPAHAADPAPAVDPAAGENRAPADDTPPAPAPESQRNPSKQRTKKRPRETA